LLNEEYGEEEDDDVGPSLPTDEVQTGATE